jgi:lysophospholipase L1-like esterase
VILISAKPSPLRWHLRRRYKKLNRHLLRLAEKTPGLEFANIWNVMLKDKKVDATLFVEDGLHMNKKGYDLWYSVLKLYLQENQNK